MKKRLIKQILVAFTVLFATGIYAQSVTGNVTSDDGPLQVLRYLFRVQMNSLQQILMVTFQLKQIKVIFLLYPLSVTKHRKYLLMEII